MVVFIKYEMEDEGRRGKRVGIWRRVFGGSPWSAPSVGSHRRSNLSLAPTSPPRERRPLRSVPAIGTQFKVDPEVLAKEYVEKETKYIGTVSDVPLEFDPGNRTTVLSLLDEKRKLGFIPYRLTWRHDVVISFSVYNVKISWRDGEDLIHRIPTHQIAATGLVQDDCHIYLFMKFASEVNDEMCNLAFFACENKMIAQEICYLTQQLFQLAYTNSTMDFFDKSIRDGAVTPKHHSCSTDDSNEKKDTVKLSSLQMQQYQSLPNNSVEPSTVVLNGHREAPNPPPYKSSTLPFPSTPQQHTPPATASTPSSPVTSRVPCRSESNNSSTLAGSNASHQQLQLHEYIEVLRERLTAEELRKFAEQLHHFRKGNLPIKIFCESLLAMYTEQRKSLLLGMRHFIPERKDRSYFENFLKRHNIETGSDDVRWWDRPPASRTLSETEGSCASTTVHINELSSNSDHVSPFHTSNEDSGEWKVVVEKMRSLRNEEPATMKKRSSVEEDVTDTPVSETTQIGADEGDRSGVETPEIPQVVLSLSEWDSPILKSGQDKEEAKSPVLPRRRGEKPSKKKKMRGKSPSAAELVAPYPSIATGGTDDDLVSSLDKKLKRGIKYKRKDKIRNGSEEKEDAPKPTSISKEEDKSKSTDDLTQPPPSPVTFEKNANTKKKFFKGKAAKVKVKKDTTISLAPSTPDPPDTNVSAVATKPPRKEHRKKRKHKNLDDNTGASATVL